MTKAELIAEISARTKVDAAKTEAIIDAISEEIIESMISDSFAYLDGLGIFWAKVEDERHAQDPKTGEEIVVLKKRWPTFTAGKPSEYAERTGKPIVRIQDLSEKFSQKCALDQTKSGDVIDTYIDVLKETLDRGENIVVSGLGVLESSKFPARSLTDPDTGERCSTEATRIYSFSSAKNVKQRVMGI